MVLRNFSRVSPPSSLCLAAFAVVAAVPVTAIAVSVAVWARPAAVRANWFVMKIPLVRAARAGVYAAPAPAAGPAKGGY